MGKRKAFISYHHDDQDEVERFIEDFGDECFIHRTVGISSDIIDSDDKDYIMRKIREKYLTDSTVTIVMIGKCTWARRYVDWEVASTLRDDPNNKRSGLMAITLPSVADSTKTLPSRVEDNVDSGYARWWKYPTTRSGLESCIEEAFLARDALANKVDNSRDLKKNNSPCS